MGSLLPADGVAGTHRRNRTSVTSTTPIAAAPAFTTPAAVAPASTPASTTPTLNTTVVVPPVTIAGQWYGEAITSRGRNEQKALSSSVE